MKCDFCGTIKEKTKLLVAGTKGHICDACINGAYELINLTPEEQEVHERSKELAKEMVVHENEVKKDYPISKTARVVAHNREITLNIFDNLYDIRTKKYQCSNSMEYTSSTGNNYKLTEETFCLLVKFLKESVEKFGIDYEAVVKELTKGKKLKIGYFDLEE